MSTFATLSRDTDCEGRCAFAKESPEGWRGDDAELQELARISHQTSSERKEAWVPGGRRGMEGFEGYRDASQETGVCTPAWRLLTTLAGGQRRGIVGRFVAEAALWVQAELAAERGVIFADAGSSAYRIYRACRFEPDGYACGPLRRPRPESGWGTGYRGSSC